MSECVTIQEAFGDDEKRKEFIAQMNIRFSVIKDLMDSLSREINNPDEEIRAKTLFCAFNLVLHLDKFVDEIREIIKEAIIAENSTVN